MKQFFLFAVFVLAALLTFGGTAMAQYPQYYHTYNKYLTVNDSEHVLGTLTVDGATYVSGSLTVSGVTTSGPTVTNDSIKGKLTITDSAMVAKTAKVNGAFYANGTVNGTSLLRGQSSFATSGLVKAIYIAGTATTDICVVSPGASGATTPPVAGDVCNCYCKTDSIVVWRAAGTTSGLPFQYVRIK